MAFYYVKSGGTAAGNLGRYTTQKTGSWATAFSSTAEYYGTMDAVMSATTPPTSGDVIVFSHVTTVSKTTLFGLGTTATLGALTLISVDDTNIDQYKPGAKLNITSTFYLQGNATVLGVSLTPSSTWTNPSSGGYIQLSDLNYTRSGNPFYYHYGCIEFDNCNYYDSFTYFKLGNGCKLRARKTLFRWSSSSATAMCDAVAGTYSYSIEMNQCVIQFLSAAAPTSGYLFRTLNSGYLIDVVLYRTKLPTGLTGIIEFNAGGCAYRRQMLVDCDDFSATHNELYEYWIKDNFGDLRKDKTTYPTNDKPLYEESTKFSFKVETTSICSKAMPFVFDLPIKFADLDSTPTVTVYVTSDTALTDADVMMHFTYKDATNTYMPRLTKWNGAGQGDFAVKADTFDPLLAGTTLPTTTGVWTSPKTYQYKLEIDVSADAGGFMPLMVQVRVFKPSTIMYFSSQVYLS